MKKSEKIISENGFQKVIENPDGTVRIIQKQKEILKDKSWFFQLSKKRWFEGWKDINPTQRVIMLSMWLLAGKKAHCWPSERHLADNLNLEPKTVCENIKILKRKKYFNIKKENGKYSHYFLLR